MSLVSQAEVARLFLDGDQAASTNEKGEKLAAVTKLIFGAVEGVKFIKEKIVNGHPKACLQRSTFIIDKKGVMRHIMPEVNPKQHVEEVLKVCRQLLNGHAN